MIIQSFFDFQHNYQKENAFGVSHKDPYPARIFGALTLITVRGTFITTPPGEAKRAPNTYETGR